MVCSLALVSTCLCLVSDVGPMGEKCLDRHLRVHGWVCCDDDWSSLERLLERRPREREGNREHDTVRRRLHVVRRTGREGEEHAGREDVEEGRNEENLNIVHLGVYFFARKTNRPTRK